MKNVWRSKLSATAYPQANPGGKLTGKDYNQIDPVFARRLAACCAMNLTEGKRSSERQKELYRQKLAGIIKSCAKPGTSYHEFGLAIDTSSQPIRGMNNSQLAKFGLCKPIKSEGWHIQPIETAKLGAKANTAAAKALYPYEQEETEVVKEIKVIINGVEKTVGAIKKDGFNYIKLRDLGDVIEVGYDATKNMPIVAKKGGC